MERCGGSPTAYEVRGMASRVTSYDKRHGGAVGGAVNGPAAGLQLLRATDGPTTREHAGAVEHGDDAQYASMPTRTGVGNTVRPADV